MASISFPALPPPSALPPLQVGAVAAVAPVALLQAELDALPLPVAQPAPAPAAPADVPDGAAMRPDQVVMARQMSWPSQDGGTLASSWRSMVRNYGTQLADRQLQARTGQVPSAVLLSGQDPRVLRQSELLAAPADAWRFTVHTNGPQEQHLRVVQDEPQQQGQQQRRRRGRAALRLELVLPDGGIVVVQAMPVADGIMIEVCAPDRETAARLRTLQAQLEAAIAKSSGLRVLRWTWRDTLPDGQVHARLPSAEAASALNLPVFRAVAELALLLPAGDRHPG